MLALAAEAVHGAMIRLYGAIIGSYNVREKAMTNKPSLKP
jgi:hypothetical protein